METFKKLITILFFFSMAFASPVTKGAKSTKVVIIGDSLSAGYGVAKENAYPAIMKKLLKEKHSLDIDILNGSVSGSTTSSLMSRLRWYKKTKPDIVIIALGANDGLRGVPVDVISKNLDEGIEFAKKMSKNVFLMGMLLPLNYGDKYRSEFEKTFVDLSEKHKINLMPFLLKDIAGVKKYNQEDGIHPNPLGHEVVAKNVSNALKKVIDAENK